MSETGVKNNNKPDGSRKVVYLMEYPIDLPGGGQMSTRTLCEGIIAGAEEMIRSEERPDRRDLKITPKRTVCRQTGAEEMHDPERTIWEPVVICPALLTHKAEDYPFRILEYKALENREDALIPRLINFAGRIRHFARLIRQEKPDLIHVSMSESLLTYGFSRLLPGLSKYPFIYTDRGLCYGYRRHTKLLMRAILKRSEGMICTTQYNKNLWVKEEMIRSEKRPDRHDLKIMPKRTICKQIGAEKMIRSEKRLLNITVIPNTISEVFSRYEEGKRELMRKRFGLSKEDFVIGFAGRISEEKDWGFVPVLVKALKEAGVSFKVALVISVYEKQDTAIAAEIRKGITDSIGGDALIYMQDLSQEEISDYYYMLDVFVMSSMFESFGKAAVEAMSRKCPVVSTSVGGLKEVVGKEENLYTKNDLSRFTDRIKRLSEDKDELERDREFFYQRYLDNYTLKKHIQKHVALYDDIVEGNT